MHFWDAYQNFVLERVIPIMPDSKTTILVATFPEGQTGPHVFLRALLEHAEFRNRCDAVLWHVPDHYRGIAGKRRLFRDAKARLDAAHAKHVFLNLDLSLAFWLCIAFRLAGAKRLVTRSLNSVFSHPTTRFGRYLYRLGVSKLAHVRIAISREAAHAMYVGAADDVVMIPCLIDFNTLHSRATALPERQRDAGGNFVFGCVGRLMAQKNQAIIIRALADLIQQAGHADLLLVGEGEDQSMLMALAATLGITDRVQFMGVTDNIGAVFRGRIDALLVPSLYEGQGRIVAEAQSFGLPIALSSGIPRMAALNANGVIMDVPQEVGAWCSAMQQLMRMPRTPAWPQDALNQHALSLAHGVGIFCDVLTGHKNTAAPKTANEHEATNAK